MFLCFVFGLVALLEVCQAQFGFASQNCLGSNCNQNNVFGRKTRQVLEEILSEVEEQEVAKHSEVARIKREIADMLDTLTLDVLEDEAKNKETVVHEDVDVHTQAKREAEADPQFAFQNCAGSNCNQNNVFGRKKRDITETIESLVHEQVKREAEADPQLQFCRGSNCNQNNLFGRRKRETLEIIKSVAKEMLEAEAEDATVEEEADSNLL